VNPENIYEWIERKKLAADKVSRLWKLKSTEADECVRQGRTAEQWETA